MINQPILSVIIPVYNTEKYLLKCLDSVLSQSLKEIEVIVVNDGSTDNSQQIIDEYLLKDRRLKSITKSNGGLSDARNLGIDNALGEYISFIDSDDYIDSSMFIEMVNLANQHNSDIVLCDLVKVNENGIEFRDLLQSPQLSDKIILEEDFTIFGEMSCFACNKIFKRELFKEHRFKKSLHFEDIELIPKLVLDSTIISKINKPFYKYFERQHSISKSHTIKGLDMFVAIDNVSNYFIQSKYKNFSNELKRFQILQGYYSYLAYVAYVQDSVLKKKMIDKLCFFIKEWKLSIKDIKQYKRFNEVYKNTLSLKKRFFYELSFVNINLITKI